MVLQSLVQIRLPRPTRLRLSADGESAGERSRGSLTSFAGREQLTNSRADLLAGPFRAFCD
jgi:hypothetical protein